MVAFVEGDRVYVEGHVPGTMLNIRGDGLGTVTRDVGEDGWLRVEFDAERLRSVDGLGFWVRQERTMLVRGEGAGRFDGFEAGDRVLVTGVVPYTEPEPVVLPEGGVTGVVRADEFGEVDQEEPFVEFDLAELNEGGLFVVKAAQVTVLHRPDRKAEREWTVALGGAPATVTVTYRPVAGAVVVEAVGCDERGRWRMSVEGAADLADVLAAAVRVAHAERLS